MYLNGKVGYKIKNFIFKQRCQCLNENVKILYCIYLNEKKYFIIKIALYIFKRECPPIASPGRFGNWNTPSLFVKEDFSYLLATQRRVAVKLDELWDMFLKSRSQLNTSGKRLRCTGLRSVRTVRFARQQIAKFLRCTINGLLLPSSLHSKLCLRSTGIGAPSTRTTGASFRSKEWAFGPFLASLLASLLVLILLISCCLVKQDMARSFLARPC